MSLAASVWRAGLTSAMLRGGAIGHRNVSQRSVSTIVAALQIVDRRNPDDGNWIGRHLPRTHRPSCERWRRPLSTAVVPPDLAEASAPAAVEVGATVGTEVDARPSSSWDDVLASVVKVYTVHAHPNYYLPWQSKAQRHSTGSGFFIGNRVILTNAHVLADHRYVLVKKHGSSVKHKARVLAIGHECDLGVLTVDSEEFWTDSVAAVDAGGSACDRGADASDSHVSVPSLTLGDLPELQETVSVVGYPQGGENLSVTAGVISRVEQTRYAHGARNILALQIDAAINPGNSGGPALLDGKVVGVAFQNLRGAENIGYLIPVPVINRFLQDVDCSASSGGVAMELAAPYEVASPGFNTLGVVCQSLESDQLRNFLGMREHETGVLINEVRPLSGAHGKLRPRDVVLAVDGIRIENDGTIALRQRDRVSFDHVIQMKRRDDSVSLDILRGSSERIKVKVSLRPPNDLVPLQQYERQPSYYIFAGIVFVPLTQPYLHEHGDDWFNSAPRKLTDLAVHGIKGSEDEERVILSQVLLDDINMGYQNMTDMLVHRVNGQPVKSLSQLATVIEHGDDEYICLELENNRIIAVNRADALAAAEGILHQYRVPQFASADIMDMLGAAERE